MTGSVSSSSNKSLSVAGNSGGFTLPELLVAGAMSAAFFTSAALVYQSITHNQKHHQTVVSITIDHTGKLKSALNNFYPSLTKSQKKLQVYAAPSYGRAAASGNVYDRFWEDVEKSSAVFCHIRHGQLNTIRPSVIDFPSGTLGTDIDNPTEFLEKVLKPTFKGNRNNASTIYGSFRTAAPLPTGPDPLHAGGTVYVIQPINSATQIGVRATYEVDLIKTNSPEGVYASVRRYVNLGTNRAQLSDYYDVFYHEAEVADFGPLFVAFEREGRLTVSEGNDVYGVPIDSYKIAKNHPFFLMWWPDPALMLGKNGEDLDGASLPVASDRRTSYFRMTAKSSLMFTVPLFPAL